MGHVEKGQLQFLGHLLGAHGLERGCLLKGIDGMKAKGSQRMKYTDSLSDRIGLMYKLVDLIRFLMANVRKQAMRW